MKKQEDKVREDEPGADSRTAPVTHSLKGTVKIDLSKLKEGKRG